MNHTGKNAVRMTNITKTFGTSTADHKVDLELRRGEILALLGENGSGKTRKSETQRYYKAISSTFLTAEPLKSMAKKCRYAHPGMRFSWESA